MVAMVSSTATTAMAGRAGSPTATTSRSENGADAGIRTQRTATVQKAMPTYSTDTTTSAVAAERAMSRPGVW